VLVAEAEADGELVGMAHLAPSGAANAPHRAEVQRVAVAESVRGGGVGRRLMAAVEEAAVERGLTLLWLTTHEGSDACTFYEPWATRSSGSSRATRTVLTGLSLRARFTFVSLPLT
jgi:GNAT superfamily N-acetyltransferase